MKIYISGKITGCKNWEILFCEAETRFKCEGVEIVSPRLIGSKDLSWQENMKLCIKALCDCDAIYMMKNWRKSKGAKVERFIAKKLGLEIIYDYGVRK